MAREHFSNLYKDPGSCNIDDQLKIAKLFPSYFNAEDGMDINRPISLKEVEVNIKLFAKETSPGLNGWTIEFYLHFFDLLGSELVSAIEYSRVFGVIPEELNMNFLTLIPKVDRPALFADYRPITLCNLVYKLITKIIAEHLKPFLGKFISPKQFGFFPNRQILDAVGIVQEVLHSIHSKQSPTIIVKLDLEKSYDKVNWTMLRLTFLQIGLPFDIVRWIMSCVSRAKYVVMVNGAPTSFF